MNAFTLEKKILNDLLNIIKVASGGWSSEALLPNPPAAK